MCEWEQLLGVAVQRKVLIEGGGDSPELGHLVLFNWEGKQIQSDGKAGGAFTKRTGVTARIGDGDEIPGTQDKTATYIGCRSTPFVLLIDLIHFVTLLVRFSRCRGSVRGCAQQCQTFRKDEQSNSCRKSPQKSTTNLPRKSRSPCGQQTKRTIAQQTAGTFRQSCAFHPQFLVESGACANLMYAALRPPTVDG